MNNHNNNNNKNISKMKKMIDLLFSYQNEIINNFDDIYYKFEQQLENYKLCKDCNNISCEKMKCCGCEKFVCNKYVSYDYHGYYVCEDCDECVEI